MDEAALTPIMQPIAVPGAISGTAIIADLCDRSAERLARSCDLRDTDCYRAYSASVSITLQLRDIDTTEVAAEVNVGAIDPQLPSERIPLGREPEAVAEEGAVALDRPIDPEGAAETKQEKRWYARRNRPRPRL